MTRPSFNQWGLDLAATVATRADCTRRQVGAVIMRPDHTVVATGYNGAPSKAGSCLRGDCPRGRLSTDEVIPGSSYDTGAGSCIALHAEQNALLRASWDEMQGGTLFCTHEPCGGCQRMLCGTPLDRVIWALTDAERETLPPGALRYHEVRIRGGRFEALA